MSHSILSCFFLSCQSYSNFPVIESEAGSMKTSAASTNVDGIELCGEDVVFSRPGVCHFWFQEVSSSCASSLLCLSPCHNVCCSVVFFLPNASLCGRPKTINRRDDQNRLVWRLVRIICGLLFFFSQRRLYNKSRKGYTVSSCCAPQFCVGIVERRNRKAQKRIKFSDTSMMDASSRSSTRSHCPSLE